ncbi:hypothetical protein HOLleu_03915 [Holothuria leucospilota]|uniref:Ig-like domain-containing protein n=1 Tax=Holothuria leucospilota TaxID=206669 RepID=A0A9Q1CTF7_HOLLE|nr:hypothetical protein HOLleu_03915 [Holothuria leucospilota]
MLEVIVLLLCAFMATMRENIADYNKVDACERNYNLEYGKKGTLACDIPRGFIGVFWYKENVTRPLISFTTDNDIQRSSYDVGDYDITPEGSLQINNVSLWHEANFRVRVVYPLQELGDFKNDMTVTVYVKPAQSHPLIDVCQDNNYCFVQVNRNFAFTCSVHGARPSVNLAWLWGNKYRVKHQSMRTNQDNYANGFSSVLSSIATVDGFLKTTSPLGVLACRYYSQYNMMEERESIVLFKNKASIHHMYIMEGDANIFTVNHQVELHCIDKAVTVTPSVEAVLWEKRKLSGESEILGHFALGRSATSNSNMEVTTNGSLILRHLQIDFDGEYLCMSKYSSKFAYRKYSVETYVPPSPNFPMIVSCPKYRNCVIDVKEPKGYLKCKLQGIRPEVQLEWIYAGVGLSPIEFTTLDPLVKKYEGGYDISLTAYYKILDGQGSQDITVACKARGSVSERFTNTSYVTLKYMTGEGNGIQKSSHVAVWLICLLTVMTFVI